MAQYQGPRAPKGPALNTTVTRSTILAQNAPVTIWRPCSHNPLAGLNGWAQGKEEDTGKEGDDKIGDRRGIKEGRLR